MKYFIYIICIIVFTSCLSANGNMEEDKYIGKSIEQVIKELGPPDSKVDQTIDNDYLPTPIEPYYPNYFSKDELEKSVIVNVTRWVKGRENIIIWAKNVENEWIVFSSLKYKKSAYIKY